MAELNCDSEKKHHGSLARSLKQYAADGIFVSTAYNSSTCKYDTLIIHPFYNKSHIIIEEYETEGKAEIGHNSWVIRARSNHLPPRKLLDFMQTKNSSRVKKEYKISLAALLRILSPYASLENELKIQRLANNPGKLTITIVKGDYKGVLLYDSNTQKADNIHHLWGGIIQKAIDHAIESFAEDEEAAEDKALVALKEQQGIEQSGVSY